MLRATIRGVPVPAARARVVNGHAFTPEGYATWKAGAAFQLRAQLPELPAGPLAVTVVVFHPRPKSRPAYIPAASWKAGSVYEGITRSDLDNHVKAVLDALQDSGRLDNDNRVVRLTAESWFAGVADPVGVEVGIEVVQ